MKEYLLVWVGMLTCRFGKSGFIFQLFVPLALATKVAIQLIAWDRGIVSDDVRSLFFLAIVLLTYMAFITLHDSEELHEFSSGNGVPVNNVARFYRDWWNGYWSNFRLFKSATWPTPAFKTAAGADLTMGVHSQIRYPSPIQPPAS